MQWRPKTTTEPKRPTRRPPAPPAPPEEPRPKKKPAKLSRLHKPEDMSLRILVPAFMISELKRAFEIGFLLFLPFLIIDLVVASVLMSIPSGDFERDPTPLRDVEL